MRSLLSSSAVLGALLVAPATALAGGSVGSTAIAGSTHTAHVGRAMAFRRVDGDTFVGTRGYLAGETLQVVRTGDGAVSHLEVATFVYTRTPYDPAAPSPGGHPIS